LSGKTNKNSRGMCSEVNGTQNLTSHRFSFDACLLRAALKIWLEGTVDQSKIYDFNPLENLSAAFSMCSSTL
jgi:hypothetical protein